MRVTPVRGHPRNTPRGPIWINPGAGATSQSISSNPRHVRRSAQRQDMPSSPTSTITCYFVSGGNGYGVTRDNRSGKDTYMKMASVGLGLGLGIKDFPGYPV